VAATRQVDKIIMHVLVHVKDKAVAVSCGDGQQPVRWLANVGTARYDDAQGRQLGQPVGVRLEDGTMLSLQQSLTDAGISDMQHVWVVYRTAKNPTAGGRTNVDEEED